MDVSLRQLQTAVNSTNKLPVLVDDGVWYSQKLTMGQPTIEKIFTKIKIAGNFDLVSDGQVAFNTGPTIQVHTSEGQILSAQDELEELPSESTQSMLVWKLSGQKRKARWISIRMDDINREAHIEALSVIYRPGRII